MVREELTPAMAPPQMTACDNAVEPFKPASSFICLKTDSYSKKTVLFSMLFSARTRAVSGRHVY